jgi:hypothetical protein
MAQDCRKVYCRSQFATRLSKGSCIVVRVSVEISVKDTLDTELHGLEKDGDDESEENVPD